MNQPSRPNRPKSLAYTAIKQGVLVLRESDRMRVGLPGSLHAVETTKIELFMSEPLDDGEQLKLELRNEIQRFSKQTRGRVQLVEPEGEGLYRICIQMLVLLTPLEVSMLRMGLGRKLDEGPRWV